MAASTPTQPLSTSHNIKSVFIIVMENHSWSSITGNSSAPYINQTLLPIASHAERYYTPPHNHPSLPNYLWLVAGTNFGISDDNPPGDHSLTTRHQLMALLDQARIPWKAYEEGAGANTCPVTDHDRYAVRHDPFVYFGYVTARVSYCTQHVRPSSQLAADLAHNTVARYNFITPNVCNDMHDQCAPINDAVKQGDDWLARTVPSILSSRAYRRGGVLFIVWDEGSGDSDGPIGLMALSPYARGHRYAGSLYYTHSSLLRTVEEIFNLHPLLGDAARARDLRQLFSAFP
jgi:phosphatidylinositol-3-phosphatase